MTASVIPVALDRATRIIGWFASAAGLALLAMGGFMLLVQIGAIPENTLFYLLGEIYAPLFLGGYALFVIWTGFALQRLRHWAPETTAIWPLIGMILVLIPGVSAFGGWFNFQSLLKAADLPAPGQRQRWSWISALWGICHALAFAILGYAIIAGGMLERYTDDMNGVMNYAQIGIIGSILCGAALILRISSAPLRETRDQMLAAHFR